MVEGAFAWIGQLAEWIGAFFPRLKIVRVTHGAIKFVKGKKIVVVPPGLAVYWPLITDWVDYPIARQGEELREQTLVTTDNKSIVVGGMLIYEVTDLSKLVGETYFPQQTVKDIALTSVHDVCCQLSMPDLMDMQRNGKLDKKLKSEAHAALAPYGVRVLKLMLTDLSPCRVYRMVNTTSKGGD